MAAKEHQFDISAKLDMQKMKDAVIQAQKEIDNRYDFKGITKEVDLNVGAKTLTLISSSDNKIDAMRDILISNMNKRGISINSLEELKKEESTAGNLDKAKALYEQAMSKIEGLSLEPWDQQSKQFVTNSLNTVEKGMGSVSDRLKLAGDAQQTTLEKTAKGLEDMLAGFSNDLSNVEKDLKDLATSLIQLQKDNAKSIDQIS